MSGRADTAERAARFLPGTPVTTAAEAAAAAGTVIVGVPDQWIESTAWEVARDLRPGAVVVHLSGALGLDALRPAEAPARRWSLSTCSRRSRRWRPPSNASPGAPPP